MDFCPFESVDNDCCNFCHPCCWLTFNLRSHLVQDRRTGSLVNGHWRGSHYSQRWYKWPESQTLGQLNKNLQPMLARSFKQCPRYSASTSCGFIALLDNLRVRPERASVWMGHPLELLHHNRRDFSCTEPRNIAQPLYRVRHSSNFYLLASCYHKWSGWVRPLRTTKRLVVSEQRGYNERLWLLELTIDRHRHR